MSAEHEIWKKRNFDGTDLGRQSFAGRILVQCSLRDCVLNGCSFLGASCDADFTGANFVGADLRAESFSGSNFQGSDLSGCDLGNAEMEDVVLEGANIAGADFSGVQGLREKEFEKAKGDEQTKPPSSFADMSRRLHLIEEHGRLGHYVSPLDVQIYLEETGKELRIRRLGVSSPENPQ